MRQMIHVQVSLEAGNRLDGPDSPGPGPLIKHIVDRFKPEAMYLSPARRELWMVATIDNPAMMAELMFTFSRNFGAYPTFTPVVPVAEFPKMMEETMEAMRKAPELEKVSAHR